MHLISHTHTMPIWSADNYLYSQKSRVPDEDVCFIIVVINSRFLEHPQKRSMLTSWPRILDVYSLLTAITLLTVITPTILDIWAYYFDVKSSVWALMETLVKRCLSFIICTDIEIRGLWTANYLTTHCLQVLEHNKTQKHLMNKVGPNGYRCEPAEWRVLGIILGPVT